MKPAQLPDIGRKIAGPSPFRRAVLGGLGVVLPPLLTIVILLWIFNTVRLYVVEPVSVGSRNVVAWYLMRNDPDPPQGAFEQVDGRTQVRTPQDQVFVRLPSGSFVPAAVFELLKADTARVLDSGDRQAIYRRYVEVRYLKRATVVPVTLCVFVLLLYLLGKFMAAGFGRFAWSLCEWFIQRVPFVRNVYGAVKQVINFMLNESAIEYRRVVAVEFPRKGIWSLGFVTGESLRDIRQAADEPVLSLMVPCSPFSLSGYTITVAKSETIDLNMTVDQALQFIVSCGVIVPPGNLPALSSAPGRQSTPSIS